jgi:DNA-binding SARP family transcriptional activator
MFRLVTFGGLSMVDADGSPLPTPRLRLGLLALLATAGSRGLTRDKVVAYLWSESPAENARHSLEQLLYSLRRQSPKDLVVGTDPLRLNPAVITADVVEFEKAIAEGSLAEATALYRGPFLDGFFLSDAPEFEVWAESERARLAREHARILYQLAKAAGSSGHHTVEIECWRKLSAVDPLSERGATGLARALASAGDWTGALQHSKAYDALVRRELGEERAQLTRLVERLRAEKADSPIPVAAGASRYAIVRQVAQGSMATVYLARDLRLNREVALKVLRPELAASTANERFHREITILAGLHHPHILQIHDSGVMELAGRPPAPYYVMPFVQGESLRQRLARETQLPLEIALRLAIEVADALAYAHGRGIVHRDIKPDNILLEAGHGLVADFGIARAVDIAGGTSLSLSGVRLGTPGYMSPEQASESKSIDGRSDIYSLGCVLYEMLAGEPPFRGATTQAIFARHASDPMPSLRTVRDEVPVWLEEALRKAMAKTPEGRFPSAERFAAALRGPPG